MTAQAASPFMGHVVENFFLYHFLEFGVLGAFLFFGFFWLTIKPMFSYAIKGNKLAQAFSALWVAVLAQWMFNDLNTYYQTFPTLILLTVWCGASLKPENASEASLGERTLPVELNHKAGAL